MSRTFLPMWVAVIAAAPCQFPAMASDESAVVFKHEGPLPVFRIEVDPANADQLRREPRRYAICTVHFGAQKYEGVGIHIKGAAGSTRAWDDKPALTLSFDKVIAKQRFFGLDKIHLNNSVQDPRYLTEILCSEMMLAAGVPTARAAHCLVELNDRKVGLYVLKEGYDGEFLKRHFGSKDGNLYDGGFLQDIDSQPKRTQGSKDVSDHSDLRDAARAARHPNLEERFAKIEQHVDVDRFLKMAAIEVLTWHWDGYAMHRNNYRVYHDLKTNKLVFIPHGMDQLWWDPNGSIQPGFQGLIMRKLMDTKEGREKYRETLAAMLEREHLKPINPGLYQDVKHHAQGLKEAIREREASVRRQLNPMP
jgi:spore coat protein CotH